jgi:hypothetical protein
VARGGQVLRDASPNSQNLQLGYFRVDLRTGAVQSRADYVRLRFASANRRHAHLRSSLTSPTSSNPPCLVIEDCAQFRGASPTRRSRSRGTANRRIRLRVRAAPPASPRRVGAGIP